MKNMPITSTDPMTKPIYDNLAQAVDQLQRLVLSSLNQAQGVKLRLFGLELTSAIAGFDSIRPDTIEEKVHDAIQNADTLYELLITLNAKLGEIE